MHWTDSLYTPRLSLLDPDHRSPAAITTSQSALRHACPILAPLVTGISVHPRIMTSVLVNVSVSVKADLRRKVALCRLRLAQWLVCKEVCIPGEAAVALQLPVGAQV